MTFKRAQKVFKADTVREDGRLERHCEHGIGHTVGHINWRKLADKWMWIHGCDGCCAFWKRDDESLGEKE